MAKWISVLLALAAIACSDDDGPAQDSGLPQNDTLQLEDGLASDGTATEDGPLSPDGAGQGIAWCNLQWPLSATISADESLTAYGQVFVLGVTDSDGAGAAVEGELGHGPVGTNGSQDSGWTWTAASYNADASANDEYMADIAPAEGTYAYAYRFRFQGGPWLYCDLDGSTNGYDAAQQGSLTVEPTKPPAVDWCNLQWPPSATITSGDSLTAFGQVYVAGVTDGGGQGAQIEGELGHGPIGTNGSLDSGWTWRPANFNKDVNANDEYLANISPPVGSYAYAFRFRYQGGSWSYCDLDGSTNGYDATQQGSLTVEPVKPPAADWCNLQWPASGTVAPGTPLTVYGQVFKAGVTDAAGQGSQIEGELGHGPVGTNGSQDSGWTWTASSYNTDASANDEYTAEISLPLGSYAYAYRFRYQGGPWLYCDLDGSTNGYDPAQQGSLTVESTKPPAVDWCNLQWPASGTVSTGTPLTVYGQVFVAGVTEATGQDAQVEGELGHGPSGTDGATDASWTWTAASFNKDVNANDEYMADLTLAVGSFAYAYRFRYQGGPWLYCDLDGSTNGYDAAQQGSLTVEPVKPPAVDWCNIQSPPTGTVTESESFSVYGQVFVAGVTDAAGQGSQIEGELGHGPAGTNGSTDTSWTWTAASYNLDASANDEYMTDLTLAVGSYAYAYRFRYQGGPWLYCDLDGSTNGFDPGQQGTLAVEPLQAPAVEWCNIQSPPSGTVTEGTALTVYGQVLVTGVTDAAGQGAQIVGELGYGPAGTDGFTDASWTWAAAAYNIDVGNNDEYMADLTPTEGSYAYAYRFRYQGGPWLYCDQDGSTNGFDPGQQGTLTVDPAR